MIVFVKRGQGSFNGSLKSVLYILVKHNNMITQECFFLGNSFTLAVSSRHYNAGPLYSPINGYISGVTQKLPYPLADTVCVCVFKP